ncbi:NepR family anti-sigma factor [Aestuariivirga litoralis]|uniref:NepR family anti-sigma factor n=1 Tax=Aestuariivirga litoralis TaxID=2650924 RepID=UPI0011B57190|nr:NepR family anti-sigma factor [Aestuariivirga litoralis]
MDRSGEFDMTPNRREGHGFQRQPLPRLRPAVHEMIGRRLRLHYEELQQQPLPGRLAALMRELEAAAEEPAEPRRG